MADYISTLTGVQMDSALLDMAEHNSEAWAVGERNGIAVPSGDATYQNNARYYAQQAQSIAPASVTEAIRWDIAQTALTDADRELARSNCAAAQSNANILVNWDFKHPVNSRGKNTYGGGYTIDKWRCWSGNSTTTLTANGLTFSNTADGDGLFQYLDSDVFTALYGKTVTVSAIIDGTLYQATGAASADCWIATGTVGNADNIVYYCNGSSADFRIHIPAGNSITISAAKLEIGTHSSLLYDGAQNYGTELARCIYTDNLYGDTYASNGFGRSNNNFIDNPFFTINQRSFTSGTTGYPADRWVIPAGTATETWSANGILFSDITTNARLRQYIPDDAFRQMLGETLTISIKCQGNAYYYVSFTLPTTLPTTNTTYLDQYFASSSYRTVFMWQPSYNRMVVDFYCYQNNHKLNAIKLEKGTRSTLCNDTQPDYTTELLKCQRYFLRVDMPSTAGQPFCYGYTANTTQCRMHIPTPVSMRNVSSVALTGSVVIYPSGASVTSVSAGTTNKNGVVVFMGVSSITAGQACIAMGSNFTLDLIADIL